tara:strand:+ start:17 stop:1141 length:1125 start_codon:yes stop_codon:yes gene_type:complete
MSEIKMVDLKSQYEKIKNEINNCINHSLESTMFINGPVVNEFSENLKKYLGVKHVIPCANGTDALQISLMSLELSYGDEVICPSFTYIATAEVIALLGLKPVLCDVDPDTFNIKLEHIEKLVTNKTKVVIPVHLYGQSADMEDLIDYCKVKKIHIIEDNAQAIGADYTFSNGTKKRTGTLGDIGTTSFFPSKNLGCYGDGGAIFTNNDLIASKIKMIANHGQEKRYYHKLVGCNSRLDALQAGILNVKLKYLDTYNLNRRKMADKYDEAFKNIIDLKTPIRAKYSTHVFHQYTIKINSNRENFIKFLNNVNIPSMIYYPLPIYKQDAFKSFFRSDFKIDNVEDLCNKVISLPIHSEIENSSQDYIIEQVQNYFK